VDCPHVICTSAPVAGKILSHIDAQLSEQLQSIRQTSLVSATLAFEKPLPKPGFGVLFPKKEGFQSLGVLFNTNIFLQQSSYPSETWILGGQSAEECLALLDEEITARVLRDRERAFRSAERPIGIEISRWPQALPVYDFQLRDVIASLKLPPQIFLCGNYLGGIGLSRIIEKAMEVAEQVSQ
jgi:oxygen-dependent protoporphyrinogen oxidase